jgi:hypothetical protein
MNRRQHATHARMLIAACGGLAESAGVCRIAKTQLSEAQAPEGDYYLPADVIVALEQHCGERSYSRAMFEAGDEGAAVVRDLKDETSEAMESVADLHRDVRLATKDGRLTPGERTRLLRMQAEARRQLDEVGEVLARDAG